jgi:hypothetical protein
MAKAKYIVLSMALGDVIPMMDLLKEVKEMEEMGYNLHFQPVVHCKLLKTARTARSTSHASSAAQDA